MSDASPFGTRESQQDSQLGFDIPLSLQSMDCQINPCLEFLLASFSLSSDHVPSWQLSQQLSEGGTLRFVLIHTGHIQENASLLALRLLSRYTENAASDLSAPGSEWDDCVSDAYRALNGRVCGPLLGVIVGQNCHMRQNS